MWTTMIGADHLREVFGHMGMNDKEIVALSGAHTLVRTCNLFSLYFEVEVYL